MKSSSRALKQQGKTFNLSSQELVNLKAAHVSDNVLKVMLDAHAIVMPVEIAVQTPTQTRKADLHAGPAAKPRLYLQSASKGTNRNVARDQSMEMSKDLEKDCPGVRMTINPSMADYTVLLNHIEVGLVVRDNETQVANKDGDLLTKTKEGGSIAGGMKKACALILADWAK